jgi:hypothetical protein
MAMKDMDARALFERSVQELDDAAVKRLRLARRAALSGGREPASNWLRWPAGFAAAAVLVLGLSWWWPGTSIAPPAPAPNTAAAPAETEEPGLAEAGDDAELYAWLGEAPVAVEQPEHRL